MKLRTKFFILVILKTILRSLGINPCKKLHVNPILYHLMDLTTLGAGHIYLSTLLYFAYYLDFFFSVEDLSQLL